MNYTLEQTRKAVLSLVGSAILLVALFIAIPVGFQEALTVVIAQGFGVAAVFLAKNHTADDLSKAVAQLASSALALVALFTQVDPNTTETVLAIVAQLGIVYGVYKARNATDAYASERGEVHIGLTTLLLLIIVILLIAWIA